MYALTPLNAAPAGADCGDAGSSRHRVAFVLPTFSTRRYYFPFQRYNELITGKALFGGCFPGTIRLQRDYVVK